MRLEGGYAKTILNMLLISQKSERRDVDKSKATPINRMFPPPTTLLPPLTFSSAGVGLEVAVEVQKVKSDVGRSDLVSSVMIL